MSRFSDGSYERKIIMSAKKILTISSLALLTAALSLSSCRQTAETSGHITPEPTVVSETAVPLDEKNTPEAEKTPGTKADQGGVITGTEPEDRTDWTKTYSAAYDIDGDGPEENISLYINAATDENGILMPEDSNRWIFEVNDGISIYKLFDSEISNGSLYAEISEYYDNDGEYPVLSLIKSTGAGLNIINYTYNKDAGGFEKSEVFSTDALSSGGINRISSSIPEPEALQK